MGVNAVTQWAPVFCAEHHFSNLKAGRIDACGCWPPGPQVRMLATSAFECGGGGSRGGMKSETGRGILLRGNTTLIGPREHSQEHCAERIRKLGFCGYCVNACYVNHPHYRALILRENEKDLADYLNRAKILYGRMGAEVTEKPARVRWPSGAEFLFGHMRDATAFTDYQGQEFQQINFEELTQIAQETLYLSIIMSCRSTFKCVHDCKPGECVCGQLIERVFSTFNPGGPGNGWVKERFVDCAPSDTIFTDPVSKKTRIFVPSLVTDNPYLMRDDSYVNQLEMLRLVDPAKYRAWRFGDWNSLAGLYFKLFRPNGPLANSGEPANARHVIRPSECIPESWYPRFAMMDWGYQHHSVVLGAFDTPESRRVIHKGFAVHETGAKEIGGMIARLFAEDLAALHSAGQDPQITLWLSPDAFAKKGAEKPVADLIVDGIKEVLGAEWGHNGEANSTPEDVDWSALAAYQGRKGITIKRALNQRIDGWQHLRDLMRFQALDVAAGPGFDPEYAISLLHDDPNRYAGYVKLHQQARRDEILPKLWIYDTLPELIKAIQSAVHDENTEDVLKTEHISDDFLDSCLVAGTLIETKRGSVPIEDVDSKDFVATRIGWCKVRDAGLTNAAAKLVQADFSDGSMLIGTANHPIWTEGGFVDLIGLESWQNVLSLSEWKRLSSTESLGSVSGAENSSNATGTPALSSAGVHVVRLSSGGTGAVYNLSVEKAEEYFANGILVHNCRYGLHSHSRTTNREPRQSFVKRHMNKHKAEAADFNDLVWQARLAEEQYAKENQADEPFSIHAASSRRSWVQ